MLLCALLFLAVAATFHDPLGDDDDAADATELSSFGPLSPSWSPMLLGLPLRLRRDTVLDHPARKAVYGLVQAHPGIHLRALVRTTGFGFGAVSYHLRVLQECGLVAARPSGARVCFFPVGVEPMAAIPQLSLRRVQVLEAVEASPGAGMGEIGELLGLSQKTIAYHVRALRAAGLVEPERAARSLMLRRSPLDGLAQRCTKNGGVARGVTSWGMPCALLCESWPSWLPR